MYPSLSPGTQASTPQTGQRAWGWRGAPGPPSEGAWGGSGELRRPPQDERAGQGGTTRGPAPRHLTTSLMALPLPSNLSAPGSLNVRGSDLTQEASGVGRTERAGSRGAGAATRHHLPFCPAVKEHLCPSDRPRSRRQTPLPPQHVAFHSTPPAHRAPHGVLPASPRGVRGPGSRRAAEPTGSKMAKPPEVRGEDAQPPASVPASHKRTACVPMKTNGRNKLH